MIYIINIILILIFMYFILSKYLCENFNKKNLKLSTKKKIINPPFKIDLVYTWAGENQDIYNIRLANNNELKYSIRSVMLNMPWINKIFILMNPPKKKPSWFNNKYKKKIILIDQSETFPINSDLPNKNSNAIETTIHNIPELSEHFIYMNDDFFIGKPVKYTDFFTSNGTAISYIKNIDFSSMLKYRHKNILKIKYPPPSGSYYHIPSSYLKSYLQKYVDEYSDYIKWIQTYKVRINNNGPCIQYNLKYFCHQQHISYMKFLYKKNMSIIKFIPKKERIYIDSKTIDRLHNVVKNPPKFFCINCGTIHIKKRINFFFKKMYPKILYFEKN